jgi:hypothetical protein
MIFDVQAHPPPYRVCEYVCLCMYTHTCLSLLALPSALAAGFLEREGGCRGAEGEGGGEGQGDEMASGTEGTSWTKLFLVALSLSHSHTCTCLYTQCIYTVYTHILDKKGAAVIREACNLEYLQAAASAC